MLWSNVLTYFFASEIPFPLPTIYCLRKRNMQYQQQFNKPLRQPAAAKACVPHTLFRLQFAVCFEKLFQHGFGQRPLSGRQLRQGGL